MTGRGELVEQLVENKCTKVWSNAHLLARGGCMLGMGLWKGGDAAVIDNGIVNGSWRVVGRVAAVVRRLQSGYLYHYALAMIVGILVLMSYFVTAPMIAEWLGR